jgi:hypothetical protein
LIFGAGHRGTGFAAFGCALGICNDITGKNEPHPSHK